MSAKNGKSNGHKNGNGNKSQKPRVDLTLKQALWVEHYLQTGNLTEASRLAGYEGSDDYLTTIGRKNLANHTVKQRVVARIAEAGATSDEIIGTLVSHMRIDLSLAFEKGECVMVDRLKDMGLGHWIKSVTWTKYGPRIEVHSSQSAATQLSKIRGLEKQPVPVDNEEQILQKATELVVQWTGFTQEQARELLQTARQGLPDNGRVM